MVGGSTDVENFDLESRASVRSERGKGGKDVRAATVAAEREKRDVGEKTMVHGDAWQRRHHGGDKYGV